MFLSGATGGALPEHSNSGAQDAFVVKYAPDGGILWTEQFGSVGYDDARVAVDAASGEVLVAGYAEGALPGQTASGSYDAFVRKYDPDGGLIWTDQFGTAAMDMARDVAVDPSGAVVVTGYTKAALPGQTASGSYDVFVRKYAADGTVIWTAQFGTPGDDYGLGVATDIAGNILATGSVQGSLPGETQIGNRDGFLRMLDSGGNTLWTDQFGTAGDDWAWLVHVDQAGDAVLAGYTAGILPGQTSSGGSWDAFVQKYSADGISLWHQQFGSTGDDHARGVSVDSVGNILVAGSTSDALPGQTSSGEIDAFVRMFAAGGDVLWTDQFGSPSHDYGHDVAVDRAGRILVSGQTQGSLPGQASNGGSDAFVRMYLNPRSPVRLIADLADDIEALNLVNGISNSLDVKLANAVKALEDAKANNDVAAINKLDAFINEVEAQSGKALPAPDAEALVELAQYIVFTLSQ